MNEILNMSINEMPRTEFDCSCGRHHSFSVHDMEIRKGAIEVLPKMAAPFKDGKILVVFDNHTYEVAGKKAVELLKADGFNVKELLFERINFFVFFAHILFNSFLYNLSYIETALWTFSTYFFVSLSGMFTRVLPSGEISGSRSHAFT